MLDTYDGIDIIADDNGDVEELILLLNKLPFRLSGDDVEKLIEDIINSSISVV